MSCEVVLQLYEWQALYAQIHRSTTVPLTPLTLREATRWIAQLGGFLARNSDGEPGVQTLWRRWRRLEHLAAMWLLLHPASSLLS
jgi:Transposase Tn5 dimerisation domain